MAAEVMHGMAEILERRRQRRVHFAFKPEREDIRLAYDPGSAFSDFVVQISPELALNPGDRWRFRRMLRSERT